MKDASYRQKSAIHLRKKCKSLTKNAIQRPTNSSHQQQQKCKILMKDASHRQKKQFIDQKFQIVNKKEKINKSKPKFKSTKKQI